MASPISIVYSHNFGFNAVLMHASGTEIRHDNKVQQVLTQRLECDNSHKDLISPGDHFAIHEAVKRPRWSTFHGATVLFQVSAKKVPKQDTSKA